jgi:MscS family membrane protein
MMILRFLLTALLLAASAQAALLPELDASSPAATLRSFEQETQRVEALYAAYRGAPSTATELAIFNSFRRIADRLFDLRDVPPAFREKTAAASVGYLADILVRLPEIPPQSIPGDPGWSGSALPAHWAIPGTEIRLVRLSEGSRAGDYVFSADTLARLPEFRAQVAGLTPLRPSPVSNAARAQQQTTGPWLASLPLERLPASLQTLLFGTPVWKLLVSVGIALVILGCALGWRVIVLRRTAEAPRWRGQALLLTVPTLLIALVVLGHAFIVWQVVLALQAAEAETIVAAIALYLAAGWAAVRACWLLAEVIINSPAFPDSTYDAYLVRIVARVGSLLASGGIVVYGLNQLGVPALARLYQLAPSSGDLRGVTAQKDASNQCCQIFNRL